MLLLGIYLFIKIGNAIRIGYAIRIGNAIRIGYLVTEKIFADGKPLLRKN